MKDRIPNRIEERIEVGEQIVRIDGPARSDKTFLAQPLQDCVRFFA